MLVRLLAIVTTLGSLPPSGPRPDRSAAATTTVRPTYRGPGRTPSATETERGATARDLDLLPWGDGYFYKGTPKERFDAEILADGAVVFHVDPSVQVKVDGVCALVVCVQTKAGREHARMRARSTRVATAIAALLTEGAIAGSQATAPGPQWYGIPAAGPLPGSQPQGPVAISGLGVQGRFGYLPPPEIAMSGFLDRTFALRLEMATRAARADMLAAGQRLSRTLAQLWRDRSSSPAQRRARVLELWLDHDVSRPPHRETALTETLDDRLDQERRDQAELARRKIIESVQRHLPLGSPHAFAASELAAFATSHPDRPRFDPYAPLPPRPGPLTPPSAPASRAPRSTTAPAVRGVERPTTVAPPRATSAPAAASRPRD